MIYNDDLLLSGDGEISFDILKEYKLMNDEMPAKGEFWKYNHYAQYLIFKES